MKKILINTFIIVFVLLSATANAQWFLQNSPSQNYNFSDVFALNRNTAFAVGYNNTSYEGIIIKTTNGGDNWVNFLIDSTGYYLSIYFVNENIGWIAGGFPDPWSDADFGIIQKTADAGENWIKDTIGVGALNSIIFVDQNTGWTAGIDAHFGPHGLIYKTTDGGVNWNLIYGGGGWGSGPLMSVFFIDNDKGWVIGGAPWEGSILITTDGGNNWVTNSLSTFIPRSIYFIDPNIGWAVGHEYSTNFGLIYKTTDGGETWGSQLTGETNSLYNIYFIDANTGWVVGSNGIILKTPDGGSNWFSQESGTINTLSSVNFVDENTGWVVGANGTILKTTNGGGIVPVELTTFTAIAQYNYVELNWATATELNNLGFEIQKSPSPTPSLREGALEQFNWQPIGFVNGNGTSTEIINYTFTDLNPLEGKSFYRLKQIDFDGTFEYSNIIEVDFSLPIGFSLEQNYPNPFNPTTTIKYSVPNVTLGGAKGSNVQLKIYDVLGNEVATLINEEKPAGNYEIRFDAAKLSSGVYFYQLKAERFLETKKMILLR